MEKYRVVPDVITEVPQKSLSIIYGDISVNPGLELTPTQVQNQPNITWTAEKGAHYTLIFTDPDVPPQFGFKQFVHWLVVDIPENDVNAGRTVFEFFGSGPPQGSGAHRYVFILYKQPGKLNTATIREIKDEKILDRGEFSLPNFVEKNKLVGPIAANFYRSQYDDYCPVLMRKIQEKYGPI